MTPDTPPTATYRLQFNRNFTFADAAAVVPYLNELGISHVYASPFLKARSGSPHGYDIVDHNALNPEVGDTVAFDSYLAALHRHDMGQILDIVPNHMGVGGDDNAWWLDLLEHGEASAYAAYFDVDWHPVNPVLHNKVLLPFLGDHYGAVLEDGELTLGFDAEHGTFGVRYYEHLFPVDPRTYPRILETASDTAREGPVRDAETAHELEVIIAKCRALPRRTELSPARRRRRREEAAACKQRLAELCAARQEVGQWIERAVAHFNGHPGEPASFEPLHQLLEAQAYRLAYWLVASDEINYRRFFDINDLAGIRMESQEVFQATHRLVRQLIRSGQAQGLRVDHPDGLSDPFGYYRALDRLVHEANPGAPGGTEPHCYLVVEKILASYEHLPADWPVAGTTGYEVAQGLNGLFVHPEAARPLTRLYHRFTARTLPFDELVYQRKKLIIASALASELTVLANLASAVAQADRHTRDFTYHGIRDALAEVVACFPVYRTYLTRERISDEDTRYISWAITLAKKRSPAADIQIFDFLRNLLTLSRLDDYRPSVQRQMTQFTLRFQQYTAPVMAKGVEDTAFYDYARLVSLNDVGFDPRIFAVSSHAFHRDNRQRLANWPDAMVNTSTHDSKRSEDVRARINVLSELPREWRQHLSRWSRLNRSKKRLVDDARAPSREDEYLLYQTLWGTWPIATPDNRGLGDFRQRIEDYMIKVVREAKVNSSWVNPNQEYEAAVRHFVQTLLDDPERNPFLADFMPFQRRYLRAGLLNGLSQTALKLTVPGVPDVYQGTELWAFNLVDPDNRRPVDYDLRRRILQALLQEARDDARLPDLLAELLERIDDGRAKLYLTWRLLKLRAGHPDLFQRGDYAGLEVQGERAEHACAFVRRLGERELVVAVARWFVLLADGDSLPPIGGPTWDDTWVEAPKDATARRYRNLLTGETVPARRHELGERFRAADLFRCFPVSVLLTE